MPLMCRAPQRSCGQDESRAGAVQRGVVDGDREQHGSAPEVGVDLRPGEQGVVAVGAGDRDQEAQAVLAAGGVEAGTGGREHVVQQWSGEAVVLDAAGGALEADLGRVLRPGEQVGHRQPGRTGQIAGEDEFRHRTGGRTGSCEGLAHGLPPPG